MCRRALVLGVLAAVLSVAARAQEYEIGPGDVIQVQVLSQPDLSGDFRVDPDGLITYPLLGKVKSSGHTVADLERKLTTLLADGYLKRPQLTVSVREYGSQKVFVTGQVQKPGPFPLKADNSLLAFLGDLGPLPATAGHEVVVIRPPLGGSVLPLAGAPDAGSDPAAAGGLPFDVGGAEVFRISLKELQTGNPERNILLQGGDTLYVPSAAQVYVTGSVARPGPYRYQDGMTVLQAVTLAGGVNERGASGRIKIVRLAAGKRQEMKVKLTDPVLPEDNVVVPERFF
jgi:polysaccharide export outer membrane protein